MGGARLTNDINLMNLFHDSITLILFVHEKNLRLSF